MRKLTRVERKMKRRRNFFKILLLLILISLGIVLAIKTNFFTIESIKVSGNSKIQNDDLIKTSSINISENIFKVSVKQAKRNIEKLPYTKEISIKRKLPRTITMEIIEREEIAQVRDISSFFIIDNEGNILALKDDEIDNLPIIIGLNIENKSPGDNIFSNMEFGQEIEFIQEAHNIGLLNQISQIDMENINSINIKLFNDINVAFGNLNNVRYNINLLDSTLEYIKNEDISCTMILMDKGENPIIVTDEGG